MNIEIFKMNDKVPPIGKTVIRWIISQNVILTSDFVTFGKGNDKYYWSDGKKVYSDDYWSYCKINS